VVRAGLGGSDVDDIELAIGDQLAKAAAGVRDVVPASKIDDMSPRAATIFISTSTP
jgi:hypothetical protein